MKVVLQRVSEASVNIDGLETRSIGQGLMILLGITHDDSHEDIEWLCKKIVQMRIFPDDDGVMNKSIIDSVGDILLVSQFTLHASTKKGNRPSYINAARPEVAIPLYEQFITQLQNDLGKSITTGKFGADMKVSLVNDGPVTIIVDSKMKE
jgi:D-tyrosyl-tRNA(Tyr) deacylase